MSTESLTKSLQKFIYPVGDSYVGTWDEEGRTHGIGKLRLTNGSFYVGQFERGLCSGYGVLKLPDGARYEGEFLYGKFHGVGVFTRTDGMKYEGEFCEGEVRGFGLLTFPDGSHGIPRNEGRFEGTKFLGHAKTDSVVAKAREAATKAYHCTDDNVNEGKL